MKVSGFDTEGNPFQQIAYAWDVSHWGARIDGIQCLKKTGQLLDIQYKGKSAKYVVVWMGKPGSREHGHIGIQNLIPERNIFGVVTPEVSLDSYTADRKEAIPNAHELTASPRPRRNRRRYTRHSCIGTVEFRVAGSKTSIAGNLTDLSLGGCYVKAQATCPKGAILELVLEVGKTRLHAQGRVVAVNPTTGMGIEFTGSGSSIRRLPALINTIRLRKD